MLEAGKLLIKLGEESLELEPNCVEIKREKVLKGQAVDVLNIREGVIAIILK